MTLIQSAGQAVAAATNEVVVQPAKKTTNAFLNYLGEFSHHVVAWAGVIISTVGGMFTTLSYLITDPSVQAALPQAATLLPKAGWIHEIGLGLITLGPLLAALRGYRPRHIPPINKEGD